MPDERHIQAPKGAMGAPLTVEPLTPLRQLRIGITDWGKFLFTVLDEVGVKELRDVCDEVLGTCKECGNARGEPCGHYCPEHCAQHGRPK